MREAVAQRPTASGLRKQLTTVDIRSSRRCSARIDFAGCCMISTGASMPSCQYRWPALLAFKI